MLCGIIAYLFKEELFTVILAPKQDDFITYRIFHLIWNRLSLPEVNSGIFSVKLINTGLAEQFIIHVKTALYVGLLCASPYILYLLFRFVSPALYTKEKKIRFTNGRRWVRYVHNRCGTKLLDNLSADLPFPRHLSSEHRGRKYDFVTIVHGYLINDEPDDGN